MNKIEVEERGEPSSTYVRFTCPGCKNIHQLRVRGEPEVRPSWTWNGSTDRPTFQPSILATMGPFPDGHTAICHSFVTDGRIQFLGDCTHSLANQTVDLIDWPGMDKAIDIEFDEATDD